MGEFDRYDWGREPGPGETVCGCGHTPHDLISSSAPDYRNLWQWFELATPVTRPTPTGPITTRWIVCCAACHRAAGGDVMRVTVREHWTKAAIPVDHETTLRTMTDPDEIRSYLEKLDANVLMELALANL